MRLLVVGLCACGRIGFDGAPDASTPVAGLAFVQQAAVQTLTMTTASVTLPDVSAHDALIVIANVASTTDVPQLADDHDQTYTNHVAASSYDADGDSMTISLALDVSPGTTTVTASLPLAVDTFEVYVLECYSSEPGSRVP